MEPLPNPRPRRAGSLLLRAAACLLATVPAAAAPRAERGAQGSAVATVVGVGSRGGALGSEPGFGVARPEGSLARPTREQAARQIDLAGGPALKVFVAREGWYRITRGEMAAAGFDPGPDAERVELYACGNPVPIVVDAGSDGRLDPWDAIEFYGLGLDTPSTGARPYWLRSGPDGLRMRSRAYRPGTPVGGTVPFVVEREDRLVYEPAATAAEPGSEAFYAAVVGDAPVTVGLRVESPEPSAAAGAFVEVVLQGGLHDAQGRVRVDLNGYPAGEASVNPRAPAQTFRIEVPGDRLLEGENTVTLTALNGPADVSLLRAVRIGYERRLRAGSGALLFTLPPNGQATVEGFPSGAIRAVDVTNPYAPVLLGVLVASEGPTFSATFSGPRGRSATVLVFSAERVLAAPEMAPNAPSTWSPSAQGLRADMVVLAHEAFRDAAERLAASREAAGIATAVVDVEDVYDEYAFGVRGPQAIRDFLRDTARWRRAPRFVLLVGDASCDPRDYLGSGSADFVPTRLVATQRLRTASDAWLADFDDDGVEDLAIGRLPVRTAEEAATVVAKIAGRAPAGEEWASRALLASDEADGYDFPRATAELLPLVAPALRPATTVFGGAGSRERLVAALNEGQLLFNYFGHGGVEALGGDVFTSEDAFGLTNGDRLPVAILAACYSGYFHRRTGRSLAEALLLAPEGGAVAVWAATALTLATPETALDRELLRLLLGESPPPLGEAMRLAKQSVTDPDVRASFVLLGDPSLRLH